MLLATLLETTGADSTGLPSIVAGLVALLVLLGALVGVVSMGIGRPHNKE